jgi:hypothetical protein
LLHFLPAFWLFAVSPLDPPRSLNPIQLYWPSVPFFQEENKMKIKSNHRNGWSVLCLVLILVFTGSGSWADETVTSGTIMHPDDATLIQWMVDIENAERAEIDTDLKIPAEGAFSLLGHLDYVPTQRNQGSCGNCWAWAGTGVMEVTLDVENSVFDRLSVQYLNSCKTDSWACCGGNLGSFASWYNGEGHAIPWSNTNASFVDAGQNCKTGSAQVSCGSIGTTPDYPIDSITDQTITTRGVAQATAIANIKNVLHQNRAIYFSFCLADAADWNNFRTFWHTQGETVTWNPDFSCGHSWVTDEGGCHAVLLVGYNDNDPSNRYWIMVNSWGTATGGIRPNGIFRLDMDMDYSCTYNYFGTNFYSFGFQTLDMDFNVVGDICECDLDHDGDCDMSDYFFFGEDWGRIDCPITTAALAEPVAANDNESGDPDAAPVEGALAFKQSIAVSNGPDDGRAEPTPPVAAGRGAPGGDIGSRVDPAAPMMSAPIWQRLDNLDPADKQNAVLELEVSADLDPAVRDDVQHAQNLWNSGAYAEAVDAVMDLEADGINMDAGISWKTPKPMPGIEWIDGDVRVSTVENVKETHLDADAQNGNLFAVLLYEDTTGGLWYWTVNFSTDGGATWAETYSWWASYQIKDVSATVVGDYLFVGYVGNTTFDGARLRRIFVSNGQVDLGYGYVTVFDKDVEIKEIALCSNADDSDNRVYYWAILNNFQLVYYWDDTGAISWTEITTGVTDAYAGLDATWNEDDASGYYLYASYVGYVIGGTELTYPVNVVRHGAGGWERITTLSDFTGLHQLTSISAYSDTVICAYEHSYTNGNGIRYNISYNGGDSWGYGGSTFGPDVGHNLYFPDVTCRGGQGSAIVYDDEAGTFDPVWFRYRDHYSAGAWDAEVKQFNEHDGATGWPNRIEWVPPSAGSSYAYGAIYISWDPVPGTAWFDRSDGGSPVDPCECDLDNDGDCDMSDYFMFGEDWGRTDCP